MDPPGQAPAHAGATAGVSATAGLLSKPERRFSRSRWLSARLVMTWLWCSRRPRIAVVTTGSPNTVPHSPTARLLVTSMLPLSYRPHTSGKNRCAAFGSNGRSPNSLTIGSFGLLNCSAADLRVCLAVRLANWATNVGAGTNSTE